MDCCRFEASLVFTARTQKTETIMTTMKHKTNKRMCMMYSYENQTKKKQNKRQTKNKTKNMLSASAITPKQDNSLPIGPNFISVHFGEENGCQKVVLGIFLSIAKVGRQGGREKENKSPRECDHSPLKSSVSEWQVIPGLPAISSLSPLPSFLHRPLLSSSTNLEAPWFLNPLLPVASQ